MKAKQNISLVVALSIPALMVVLVAASIYLPALLAPAPRINFVYMTGDDGYGEREYVVEHGLLVKHDIKHGEQYTPPETRFFLHDTPANTDKELSFDEAEKLKLDDAPRSSDGWEVVYGNMDSSIFPFFFGGMTDYNTMYLKGHHTSRKLNLRSPDDGRYYYRARRFLGWVE